MLEERVWTLLARGRPSAPLRALAEKVGLAIAKSSRHAPREMRCSDMVSLGYADRPDDDASPAALVRCSFVLSLRWRDCAGCASGGSLQVTKIVASADQPANVAVYLDVKDKAGRPIPGLQEKNFRVYEDGKLVTTSKAKRALLEPKHVRQALRAVAGRPERADRRFGGSARADRRRSASSSITSARRTRSRSGAFDGNDEVVPFLGYGGTAETKKVVEALRKFRPRSRNTNLNGAVYQGLHSLRDRLKDERAAQKSAILVIFTDRGELAHSVSPETLKTGFEGDAGGDLRDRRRRAASIARS